LGPGLAQGARGVEGDDAPVRLAWLRWGAVPEEGGEDDEFAVAWGDVDEVALEVAAAEVVGRGADGEVGLAAVDGAGACDGWAAGVAMRFIGGLGDGRGPLRSTPPRAGRAAGPCAALRLGFVGR
jgi:hypothetical protein